MHVYKAQSKHKTDYILTTEKPDDVDEPAGEIQYVRTNNNDKGRKVFISFEKLKELRKGRI